MKEMVQMAQERHQQLAKSIAKREAEIESFREEAKKLDMFLGLATELFGPDEAAEAPKAIQPAAAPEAPKQPVAETARLMPARQARSV